MKNLWNRIKCAITKEDGMSTTEAIVILAVILVIAVALFLFGDQVVAFLQGATGDVESITNKHTGNL